MQATRTLLSKQTLTLLTRQPACFVHHGDYGNWGNTNIAVVSGEKKRTHSRHYGDVIVTRESRCGPGVLRMWLVGWD